jgi:hypothetical protein
MKVSDVPTAEELIRNLKVIEVHIERGSRASENVR